MVKKNAIVLKQIAQEWMRQKPKSSIKEGLKNDNLTVTGVQGTRTCCRVSCGGCLLHQDVVDDHLLQIRLTVCLFHPLLVPVVPLRERSSTVPWICLDLALSSGGGWIRSKSRGFRIPGFLRNRTRTRVVSRSTDFPNSSLLRLMGRLTDHWFL